VKQPRIVPNLWFDTEAEEAAKFYVSVFKNSRLITRTQYSEGAPREAGMVMTVEFELDGQRFVGINGGPQFEFDEAVSFQISCKDQDEVDYYWEKLTGDGGEEGPCGWCKDRFGVSWQVVPTSIGVLLSDPDSERAQRAMEAMLKMHKLDIAELERAAAAGEDEVEEEVEVEAAEAGEEPEDAQAEGDEEKATA
jgi:predicted 3-demethylubiquinone-9 3-methyltransferase (glyoxalase superfamily)